MSIQSDKALSWQGNSVQTGVSLSLELVSGLVRLADVLVLVLAAALPYYIYVHQGEFGLRLDYATTISLGVIVAAIAMNTAGAYQYSRLFLPRLDVGREVTAWMTTIGILLFFAFALKVTDNFSRVFVGSWFFLGATFLCVNRMVLVFLIRNWADEGRLARRTIVVGAGENGARLARFARERGDHFNKIIGFVDDRMDDRVGTTVEGTPVLGTTENLIDMIKQERVDQVFIALPWGAESRVREIIHLLAMHPVHIRLAPDLVGFHFADRNVSQFSGLTMLNVFDRPISGHSFLAKTVLDRLMALFGILVISPVLLLTALAIKLDSRGPVLFVQKRVGFNNNLINVYKFRSMYSEMTDENAEQQTVKGDARVTRVGRFIRRTSIDELPQLFNVLFGDMSMVGPRPHAISTKAAGRLFEEVVSEYASRHRVKPGITGWAQINGWRGETDTEDKISKRVEHDLYYIDNWSIWLDLKIILKTPFALFGDENAF